MFVCPYVRHWCTSVVWSACAVEVVCDSIGIFHTFINMPDVNFRTCSFHSKSGHGCMANVLRVDMTDVIFGNAELESHIASRDAMSLHVEPRFCAMHLDGIKNGMVSGLREWICAAC